MSVSETSNQSIKIRVFKPNAIVLGLHGTIASIDWEDNCIEPYIRENIKQFLTNNWNNSSISQLIPRLRQESFDQHFVYENSEAPLIGDNEDDLNEQILSLNEFLIWQMNNKKETKESQRIFTLVWEDGINKRQITLPLFKDVVPALKAFREKSGIKVALFSSIDQHICRKLFENTTEGDITTYFDHYFDYKTNGSSKDIQSFKQIANKMNVKPEDVLYVIDYGQSAKCAKELGFQCLLINRPKNRRIRDYYLIRFNTISSLLDIEFVER